VKKIDWRLKASVLLIISSALLYSLHFFVFRDAHHLFIYLVGDLAFIPIEVLLVSLVIEKMIKNREKEVLLEKLNLIIGLFFNEVGTMIIKHIIKLDKNINHISNCVEQKWIDKDFKIALKKSKNYQCKIEFNNADLETMKEFLLFKRDFLIKLLENPNLLEHETFTHLLTAVFHLEEELSSRNLSELSHEDQEHINVDITRVYDLIISQWLLYMKHLKNTFPYFFVTAMKNNPFNQSVEN
jgi:hypothetical protein